MAFQDISDLADKKAFQKKVKGAMVTVAKAIVGEALIIGKNQLFKKRHALGVEILNTIDAKLYPFALAAAANPTVLAADTAVTDVVLQAEIEASFNDIAGVDSTEL